MAKAPLFTTQISTSKFVQEISKKCDQVPEEYVHKDGFPAAIDAPESWTNDLLIDVSLLSSSSSSSSPSELAKLKSALSQWGCIQVINHGIKSSFLEDLIEVVKQFFALPLEEKLKCVAEDDKVEGYGSDQFYSGTQTPAWNDRLFLTLYPEEKIKHQCWPHCPENFSEMVMEYSRNLAELNKVICKAMARSLNLDESSFNVGKNGPPKARFTLYPPCPCPEKVLGIKPHSDSSTMTYLLPEIQGLEILKDDQWYKVPAIKSAIVINMGDLGEAITNGVFKSAIHRVSTNSTMERISVTMFYQPYKEEEIIEPLSELVSAHQPQLFKKFKLSEFRPKMFESFRLGSRAIDAFRV